MATPEALSEGLVQFCRRHPRAAENEGLLQEGTETIEQLDVSSLWQKAESLLLHPSTCLATAGCIRPLLIRIIGGYVERRAQASDAAVDGDEDEAVAVSISHVLRICPQIEEVAYRLFSITAPPHGRIHRSCERANRASPLGVTLCDCLQASLRVAETAPRIAGLWNWRGIFALSASEDEEVRWCVARITAAVLGVPARVAMEAMSPPVSEEREIVLAERWLNSECLAQVERAAMALDSSEPSDNGCKGNDAALPLPPGHTCVAGIDLPSRRGQRPPSSNDFVRFGSAERNLERLSIALCRSKPILLEGHLGCGKSSLVREAAHLTGNTDILTLHLDDQADSKNLLGGYVCGAAPGDFRWQPGVLTHAVLEGRWLLIKDIDLAPSEILSLLAPLLEDGKLYISERGETIEAARGFQLFATLVTGRVPLGHELLGGLWAHVWVDAPSPPEAERILSTRYNIGPAICHRIVQSFLALQYASGFLPPEETGFLETAISPSNQLRFGRPLTSRDLMKWGTRLQALHGQNVVEKRSTSFIPEKLRECSLYEGVDLLIASVHSWRTRERAIEILSRVWEVSLDRVNAHVNRLPEIEEVSQGIRIGRSSMSIMASSLPKSLRSTAFWSNTAHARRLLEHLSLCVQFHETPLLVGETGVGKTAAIQQLANLHNVQLSVVNMSQQSDPADLLGGFKPVDARVLCIPLYRRFQELFLNTFSCESNAEFLSKVFRLVEKKKWMRFLKAVTQAAEQALAALSERNSGEKGTVKRQKSWPNEAGKKWNEILEEAASIERQLNQREDSATPVFSFVEGVLVQALKNGHWILLDEINLAPPETLQRLEGILNNTEGSLILSERGDISPVERHPRFRLFACMNPANDVGKRDLSPGLKSKMTEIFVEEPTGENDLQRIVQCYLQGVSGAPVGDVVSFYQASKKAAREDLYDSSHQMPQYNLRTLSRALEYTRVAVPIYGLKRGLYDGLCMTFLTSLHEDSVPLMDGMIRNHVVKEPPSRNPHHPSEGQYVFVEGFWIEAGDRECDPARDFVLTDGVKWHLQHLARAIIIGRYPVLLQGPTGSGKTSLVNYLARRSGRKFVRINNHEHTDLAEYLGTYVSNTQGKLEFQEGALVQAVRYGHWIVLDELNLAPTDVLEALNRLLDDNNELFVPETQEVVRPHPHFMLFATQNPPNAYAGRKVLSRAFKNRFLEVHIGELPDNELATILETRCPIPRSYCQRLVHIMRELRRRRQGTNALVGKEGFITVRDLLKWGKRAPSGNEALAETGYHLLAERLRKDYEKDVVESVLRSTLGVTLNVRDGYQITANELFPWQSEYRFALTRSSTRLLALVHKAIEHGESALLVGETGTGKTVACQLLASIRGMNLHMINCHQQTETSDFIGSYRPATSEEAGAAPFEWVDGPLVKAMRRGEMLLIDELSLAEDSVIERLNSVLDDGTLALTEKGGAQLEVVEAAQGFTLMATMNPGGDFGKKELSPALRNRFTEIFVPVLNDDDEVSQIVSRHLGGVEVDHDRSLAQLFVDFWHFTLYHARKPGGFGKPLSIRDLVCWAEFVHITVLEQCVDALRAFLHGAFLVLLDGVGLGSGAAGWNDFRNDCETFLSRLLSDRTSSILAEAAATHSSGSLEIGLSSDGTAFGVHPFYVALGQGSASKGEYEFMAPTTSRNCFRILRAMQLRKPIMLEGLPGVGKTSLIEALAAASGHDLVRINLSQQTDMMDLIGAHLPKEDGAPGEFQWNDGPLLEAIKTGKWVLLDELNLAPQSVLEGLNSILDHRAEMYIPEVGTTFHCAAGFRVFSAQNPMSEGGGRKGLPQSFLNRFTRVHVHPLGKDDMESIVARLHPSVPASVRSKMIQVSNEINHQLVRGSFGVEGAPWDFNLRELDRWLTLTASIAGKFGIGFEHSSSISFQPIYSQCFRKHSDQVECERIKDRFLTEQRMQSEIDRDISVTPNAIRIGTATIERDCGASTGASHSVLLHDHMGKLETMAHSVEHNWLCILVGPSGCGKTVLLRQLAGLCGRNLREIQLTSATDTNDLLGSFEQAEPTRKRRATEESLRNAVASACGLLVRNSGLSGDDRMGQVDRLTNELEEYEQQLGQQTYTNDNLKQKLLKVIDLVQDALYCSGSNADNLVVDRDEVEELPLEAWSVEASSAGKFEWVDGPLLKAVQNGEWVVLDNANLCNASVLDRLNSLLDRGKLLVNECGTRHSSAKVVEAHPNFRLFLSMDPTQGSLSRAMRNRGLEVAFGQRSTNLLQSISHGWSQYPPITLPSFIAEALGEKLSRGKSSLLREASEWTKTLCMLLERGFPLGSAWQSSFQHVFPRERNDQHLVLSMNSCQHYSSQSMFSCVYWPFSLHISSLRIGDASLRFALESHPLLEAVSRALQSDTDLLSKDLVKNLFEQSPRFAVLMPLDIICSWLELPARPKLVNNIESGNIALQDPHRTGRMFLERGILNGDLNCRYWFLVSLFQPALKLPKESLAHEKLRQLIHVGQDLCKSQVMAASSAVMDRRECLPFAGRIAEDSALLSIAEEEGSIMQSEANAKTLLDVLAYRHQQSVVQVKRLPPEPASDYVYLFLRSSISLERESLTWSLDTGAEILQSFQMCRWWLLRTCMNVKPSDVGDEIFCAWLETRRHLHELRATCASPSRAFEEVLRLAASIDGVYKATREHALWHGPSNHFHRPLVLRSLEAQELRIQTEQVCERLNTSSCKSEQSNVVFDTEAKRRALEALSLISLLPREKEMEARNIFEGLREHLEKVQSNGADWVQSGIIESGEKGRAGVHALNAALSIRAQPPFCVALSLANPFVLDRGWEGELVEKSLVFSPRSVRDLVPHKMAEWLDESGESWKRKALLPILGHEAWVGLHRALWKNHLVPKQGSSLLIFSMVSKAVPSIVFQEKEGSSIQLREAPNKLQQLRSSEQSLMAWRGWNQKDWEQAALRVLLKELLEVWADDVHPDERSEYLENVHSLAAGHPFSARSLCVCVNVQPSDCRSVVDVLLKHLPGAISGNETDKLGMCWLLLGMWRMLSHRHAIEIDPVMLHKNSAEKWRHWQLHELRAERLALESRVEIPMCPSEPERRAALADKEATAQQNSQAAEEYLLERPSSPSHSDLKRDVDRARSTFAHVDYAVDLSQRVLDSNMAAISEARGWIQNALEWVDDVESKYGKLRDIAQPFEMAAYEMAFGMDRLISHQSACGSRLSEKVAHLMKFPVPMFDGVWATQGLSTEVNDWATLEALRIDLSMLRHKISCESCLQRGTWAQIEGLLQTVSTCWHALQVQESQQAAQQESWFEIKHSKTPETEEQEEAQYASLFPDSSFRFRDLEQEGLSDKQPEDKMHSSQKETLDEASTKVTRSKFEALLVEATLGATTASPENSTKGDGGLGDFLERYDFASRRLGPCLDKLPPSVDEATELGHFRRVVLLHQRLIGNTRTRVSLGLQNSILEAPQELTTFNCVLGRFQDRINQLLQEFEVNPILNMLTEICDRLLNMDITASMKQALTGLELLLSNARIWESNAAKHVSLSAELEECANLARSWRKSEMESWRGMIEVLEERFAADSRQRFFSLLRLITQEVDSSAPHSEEEMQGHYKDLAATLEQFIHSGPIGGYTERTKLLEHCYSFAENKLSFLNGNDKRRSHIDRLARVIANVHGYYKSLESSVLKTMRDKRKAVHDEIEGHIRLAKWEDRKYAFEALFDRFHWKDKPAEDPKNS